MDSSPVILSYGMGVDSTAILVEWLKNPSSRWFDLTDLIVLTAQVGDEFCSTGRLIEQFILPLLRANCVRFVQVARRSATQTDGYAVLEDSEYPTAMHLDGCYKLSTELLDAGTIPTSGMCRKCSLKAKGWVLDKWIDDYIEGNFTHVMGFNADELKRVEKDKSYSKIERQSRYPLVEWGWGRKKCEEYLLSWTGGVRWEKSCCGYCPFAGQNAAGRKDLLRRFRNEPEHAMLALRMEQAALALNPRMKLYSSKTVRSVLSDDNPSLVAAFDAQVSAEPWALYRVRRVFIAKGNAKRSVEVLSVGTKRMMYELLREKAAGRFTEYLVDAGDVLRLDILVRPDEPSYPCPEEAWVAAPYVAQAKTNGKVSNAKGLPTGFYKYWKLSLSD